MTGAHFVGMLGLVFLMAIVGTAVELYCWHKAGQVTRECEGGILNADASQGERGKPQT